jgi:Ubiquitin elongating factor core
MDDLIEFLLFTMAAAPAVLEAAPMDDLVVFVVTFLTSTQHVKNPFLRTKLVNVRGALKSPGKKTKKHQKN